MTPAAREWGVTLLRLWIGFLILHAGLRAAGQAFAPVQGLPSLLDTWKGSAEALIGHLVILVQVAGGAGILAGLAVRLCSLFTAAGFAWLIWKAGGLHPGALMADPLRATLLVGSVSFLLTGPGFLNLGRVFQKKR
ncbi:MAG: DoxX family protein [Nitrospinota bacterium]